MYYFCRQDLFKAQGVIEISGHTQDTGKFLWTAGKKFDKPLGHQVLTLDPSYGENLADFFDTTIPVMSDRLIAAFEKVGVDNFDLYPVTLRRNDTGEEFDNYKAVNFIGCIDAIDMEKTSFKLNSFNKPKFSGPIVLDPSKVYDFKAFRLSVGPSLLVVSEDVAKHLIAVNFKALLLQNLMDYKGI
jgi:hypothetical protein